MERKLVQNLQDEEIKDIACILGIDANDFSAEDLQKLKQTFAEAYEITAFIADDPETLDMLTQFGKDYAGAQSTIEWAEFAGGGVFEIVLTALLLMFTGGVGNVAQAASKIRHAGKLKSLGLYFVTWGGCCEGRSCSARCGLRLIQKSQYKLTCRKIKKYQPNQRKS